jgi:cell pole-organizing protein PopZ
VGCGYRDHGASGEQARTDLQATALAVQSAFHALDQAILIHNAWTLDDLVPLKGMVCEMIRPMLKAWLDDKLPAMVERLVRTAIERRRS